MRSDTVRMPGYKRACRFCGQLVDEDSVVCPFCTRNERRFIAEPVD